MEIKEVTKYGGVGTSFCASISFSSRISDHRGNFVCDNVSTYGYQKGREKPTEAQNCIDIDTVRKAVLADKDSRKFYNEFYKNREKQIENRYRDGEINIIKYFRLKRRITQIQLAKEINTSQSNISALEKLENIDNIPFGKIESILSALSVTPEEFNDARKQTKSV